jgi:hypothetical protein
MERGAEGVGLTRAPRLAYPRKLIARTRKPARCSSSACFLQLSLLKRPPWASTTARSPLPYRSAWTVPPSRVGKETCSWAAAMAVSRKVATIARKGFMRIE